MISPVVRWWVRRSSDERVERMFSRRVPQRLLMRRLARAYRPDEARAFEGELGFVLETGDGERRADWTLHVDRARAQARSEPARSPALRVRARVVDLVRVLAGDLDTDDPFLAGRAGVTGNLLLAARLDTMFDLDRRRGDG